MKETGKRCENCNSNIPEHERVFAIEKGFDGYFCEVCEYYHYFNENTERPKYRLFLERSENSNDEQLLIKPEIKLSKRLSPLRYPGGKTRLIDFMFNEIYPTGKNKLFSPFAGGASVEFAMLDADVVDEIVLNDLDEHLMNFYHVVFYKTASLLECIDSKPLTVSLYEEAHEVALTPFSELNHLSKVLKAFYYLINNRCSFSGIYNAGRMGGKEGTLGQLSSRWNPKDMKRRIKRLGELSTKVTLTNYSYEEFIELYAWEDDGVFVIDPPYVEKAQDIYRHAFDLNEHRKLFNYLTHFWASFPNADFFVFYDNHPHLYDLPIPEDINILARKFSIAN